MRPNPAFDQRVQQPNTPIYPPDIYQRPVVRSVPVGYQQGYPQNQQIGQVQPIGQVYQVPNYQVHPMQQVHVQYPQNSPVTPNVQIQPRPLQQPEPPKSISIPENIQSQPQPQLQPQLQTQLPSQQFQIPTQGNNRYPQQGQQEEYQQEQGEQGDEEQQMKNQQIIMFWEHKFYTILQRFQLIYEKVDGFRVDFGHLNEELRAVDSQEEWNQAKDHHEDYLEQLQEFTQELAGVINENATLVERDQNEHDNIVWKNRYFELFDGYKTIEQELNEMKEGRISESQESKVEEMRKNYKELERAYTQAVNELNDVKQIKVNGYESAGVDKNYMEKLDWALHEAEKYKEMLEQLSKQNDDLDALNSQLKNQNINLEKILQKNEPQNYHQDYEQFKREIAERDNEIHMLNSQLKQLIDRYDFLVETHNSLQNQIQNGQFQIPTNPQPTNNPAHEEEIRAIRVKIHESQSKERSIQALSDEYQRLLKIRTEELQERNEEIQRLKRELSNVGSLKKNDSDKDLTLFRKDQQVRVKKIEQEYELKYETLKSKLRKKEEQVQNTSLLSIKIQSLEKKNKILLQEVESLNNDLIAREKQLLDLKKTGHSQQRIKEFEYQYTTIIQQKQQLSATLLQRNYVIDSLQTQVNEFESRIKGLSDKTYANSSNPLLIQIEELNNLVHLKENQIHKIKANFNLRENQLREYESEIEKVRNSLISNEKINEIEKESLKENVKSLERRSQQNEKRMRDLQFEFGSVMKSNLEEEIKNLRNQNQSRQQTIIGLEAEQLELRSRISHFQRVRTTHNADIEELTSRIKELQNSKFDMIKKVENSFRDVRKKEKQNKELIDLSRQLKDNIIRLESQISQTQKLITEKDKIIDNLEGQLLVTNERLSYITQEHDSLRMRRRDQTDLFIKQSDGLKRKIFDYEHTAGARKQFRQKFSSQITKIQSETIQQLRQEKEFLKSELASALDQLGQLPNFQKKQNGSLRKSKASEGIDYIQKRLFDFNGRLDDMILKNKNINSKGFGNGVENWNSQNKYNTHGEEQIKNLKGQISELRKYISKLEVEAAGQTIKFNPKSEIILAEQQKNNVQRIEFYQNQANELEARIESLIKVNQSLKQRVDSLLKGESSSNTVGFYREQLAISEETINNLNAKIKKILEENRNLRDNNNESTTKMCREYEDKIFECENKIFTLERKINNLQLDKTKTQNERIGIQRTLHLAQTELQTVKSSTEKYSQDQRKNNQELSDQVTTFENEISDLLTKIRLLESENDRLSQAMTTTYSQQHILMNTPVKGTPAKPSIFKK